MAASLHSRVLRRRSHLPPRWPFTLNAASPLALGLIGLYPLLSRIPLDITQRQDQITNSVGVFDFKPSDSGVLAADANEGANNFDFPNLVADINGLSATTALCWIQADAVGVNRAIFNDGSGDPGYNCRYDSSGFIGGGTNVIKVGIKTTDGSPTTESDSNVQTTAPSFVGFRWLSGNDVEPIVDGRFGGNTGSSGVNTGTISGIAEPLKLFTDQQSAIDWRGLAWSFGVWSRYLSDAEIWALYDPSTRWDLYYELGRRLYSFPGVAAAAGAGRVPYYYQGLLAG